MRRTLLLAALAAGVAAQAQLIVANDAAADSIYAIDVNTGVATALNTGGMNNAWGMAADNVNGVLYWNDGGNLHSATFASILSGTATPTTTALTFNGAGTNYVSLAYNPATGMLLGTRNIATEAVYEIDPITGIGTQVYVYASTFDFGGLDYDAPSGGLFGLSDAPSTARGLYSIDTGAQTETLRAPYPAGETDIDGLAVGEGRAYYVTDGPNTTQANMYVFDIATGTQIGTLASPFTGSGVFSAGAWAPALVVPEPATFVGLGLGIAAFFGLRRKR